jgi:uncharacterized membrane protein
MDAQQGLPRWSLAQLWLALWARPRLLVSLLVGLAVYLACVLLGQARAVSTLIGWNAGVLLDLALTAHMVRKTDVEEIKRRALSQDQGRMTILVAVVLGSAAVLLAVGTQLSQIKNLAGLARTAHLALAILTVVSSWLFTQTVFAIHYAHDFYTARIREQPDPLEFPGTPDPLYGDFFHFSCVIGTSAQTADISFHGSALRPVGTLHCIVSFFFNASLLALAINVVAGVLIQP